MKNRLKRGFKMDKKYILFDLDGTLTDPKEGITKCVQYALKDASIDEPDLENLICYIGPPLDESFKGFHHLDDAAALRAVDKYRERFKDIGIFENKVIEGIPACLETLKNAGKVLLLATCKPEPFAYRIMEHFGLLEYFTVITGSNLDGTRKYKNEVIEEAFIRLSDKIKEESIIEMKAAAIMTGDRKEDINGAHKAGIEAVGVRFGYAQEDELEQACADYIVSNVSELTELLI